MQEKQKVRVQSDPFLCGAVLISVSRQGECQMRGLGEIDIEAAEIVARNLIILASRIRNAARANSLSLH